MSLKLQLRGITLQSTTM